MKTFIPKNKTKGWVPQYYSIDWTPENIKEYENIWLNHIKEDRNSNPFSLFIIEQGIIRKINEFVNDFENKGFQIPCDLDLIMSDEYYKALNHLIIEGKFRSLNVKIADMMPPDIMFITPSQKTK